MFSVVPTLIGSRVRLEPLSDAVLEPYLVGMSDPEVSRLTGTRRAFTRSEVVQWLRSRRNHDDRADWAVLRADDGTFLGEAVLNDLDEANRSASYRVWLAGPSLFGKGFGTEATRLVLDHAFGACGLHRVSLEVFAFNHRARHVYGTCGFRTEGVLREALSWDGRRHDVLVMGILATDPR